MRFKVSYNESQSKTSGRNELDGMVQTSMIVVETTEVNTTAVGTKTSWCSASGPS
jgi:hypothetical protein